MALMDAIAARLGYGKMPRTPLLQLDAKAAGREPEWLQVTAEREAYNIPNYALAHNQLSAAQVQKDVALAVKVVSQYSATTPFQVFELSNEDRQQVDNHPFELLLQKPNPRQPRFRLFESTFAYLILAGNAYWHLNMVGGSLVELYVLPPDRIRPVPGSDIGLISHYTWDAGQGKEYPIPPEEICHFQEFHPTNIFTGMSRIEPVAKQVEKDTKAETYDLNYFARDNFKPEAIMNVGATDADAFEAIKRRLERRHGGTNRSVMLVRGLEKIDYQQLASNYIDMDYINNRRYTSQEILNQFAPGLAAILAVNTTEANSRTAKATLMEMAVWPLLVSVHETISNRILPLYGDNLLGEFEDVRLSDKAMELSELQEYSKYHTVNEVRQEKYRDDPLTDERGEMLVAQIGQSSERFNFQADVVNPVGVPPGENVTAEPPPAPDGTTPQAETGGQPKAAIPVNPITEIHNELEVWQRFVNNRLKKGKALRAFNTDHIPAALKGAVEGALEAVEDAGEVAAIFADALTWENFYA